VPDLDLSVVWNFATALLIGALIGIERERHHQQREDPGSAGLRTFMLFALIGALSGSITVSLESPWILAAGLLAVVGAVLAGYVQSVRLRPETLGLTTELAAIATYLLGAIATLGERELAVGIGVVVAAVLAYKQPMHGFVQKLGSDDVYAAMRLLIATFIVLPLLPGEPMDPWEALNPQQLWLLVLLISGLSVVGYVLTRALGANKGIPITGLTGGMVSSTAVTLAFARQSKTEGYENAGAAFASGVLLAWTVSFVRVIVEIVILNRALLPVVLPALAAMTIVSGACAWFLLRRTDSAAEAGAVELRNPFSLTSAMKFAAFFALVILIVKIVQTQAPPGALYVVAALAGTTDMDAITLSMAEYGRNNSLAVAAHAIIIAALSNTTVKAGMVVALGGPQLRMPILLATAAILATGIAAILLT
jgi:uncharacterized membrane protein (DUF4010 family)